jgi:hypothetical protein
MPAQGAGSAEVVAKRVVAVDPRAGNLVEPGAWQPWKLGFDREAETFVCDNGTDVGVERGASQTVVLDQNTPRPIVASVWSKAEGVGGSSDSDYSLYLDLTYQDGTPLWGRIDAFDVGDHDWQKAQVVVFPDKPVASVQVNLLLRRHAGKAWFRDPQLQTIEASLFDGVAIAPARGTKEGFQVRDVAAGSSFMEIDGQALGLAIECRQEQAADATFFDVTLSDTSGRDRAVTLLYVIPVSAEGCRWLADLRRDVAVEAGREYGNASSCEGGAIGRLSRYPLAAVASQARGRAIGIDMTCPAFFRVGYSAVSQELFLAYDIGLAAEKPAARLRFCKFGFDPKWGFRAAMAEYYRLFEGAFRCRTPEQGLWMPFAKISDVNQWQDFGFAFKEGDNETQWDDQHGIKTFRYTEPMTWWMSMPKEMPRSLDAALGHARSLAEKGNPEAKALFTSGFHDPQGRFCAHLLDTPWCNGAVWSMNSSPRVAGEQTDFSNKWGPAVRDRLYGPSRKGDLDGEYIDSSEGYVTNEMDFRRDHFAASQTPLTFSLKGRQVGVYRGLIVFEYVAAIAADVHAMDKWMMANGTPGNLCWLAPFLDVMGTETDWNPQGKWEPMSDEELLYRRALCKGKPYCFLMNTDFDRFSHDLVERYFKRAVSYGMFPGFFSHNASEGHYFSQPRLYERDRDLFKKYIPVCRSIAQAGWEPITLARSDNPAVHVERFGKTYLTAFNDGPSAQTATLTLDGLAARAATELLQGRPVPLQDGRMSLSLQPEDLAVLRLE